jgi:hypothetical protein
MISDARELLAVLLGIEECSMRARESGESNRVFFIEECGNSKCDVYPHNVSSFPLGFAIPF